ncbi:MAG: hypothetical protein IKK17_05920 [Oscillospiraceae bacterium]|nr:hypothetical protein [Oscillospiraceae bacterium]
MKMKKVLAMLLAVLMIVTATVAGTVAWLQVETADVVNTFTDSDINITLEETTNNYQMVPGSDIAKNPKVTVEAGSEDCWLFVEITKSANYDQYLEEYVIAEGWTKLKDGVYYREAKAGDEFAVLNGNKVTVKTSVTKAMMDAIDGVVADDAEAGAAAAEVALRPTLTFKAYAVQKANVADVDDAWAIAKGIENP